MSSVVPCGYWGKLFSFWCTSCFEFPQKAEDYLLSGFNFTDIMLLHLKCAFSGCFCSLQIFNVGKK